MVAMRKFMPDLFTFIRTVPTESCPQAEDAKTDAAAAAAARAEKKEWEKMCEKNFFSGKIELPKKSVAIASVDMAEMGSFSTNKELKFTLAKNNFFASI